MMRTRRAVGIVIVAPFALIDSAFLYLDYAISKFGGCRIVRLASIHSPDGSKSVITFRKECGATVPDSTHASIASTAASFSPEQAPPFFSVRDGQDILVAWSGERAVRIGLIPGSDTFYKREQSVGDIKIEYE
jgi:hypothetical protein